MNPGDISENSPGELVVVTLSLMTPDTVESDGPVYGFVPRIPSHRQYLTTKRW